MFKIDFVNCIFNKVVLKQVKVIALHLSEFKMSSLPVYQLKRLLKLACKTSSVVDLHLSSLRSSVRSKISPFTNNGQTSSINIEWDQSAKPAVHKPNTNCITNKIFALDILNSAS